MFNIHCDGAYSKKHDLGGYAGLVTDTSIGRTEVVWGRVSKTTSQRMELTAIICSLRAIPLGQAGSIRVYTDSEYVVKGLAGEYQLQANLDLWDALREAVARVDQGKGRVKVSHLPRNSTPELEKCDLLAKKATDPALDGPDYTRFGASIVAEPIAEEAVDTSPKEE